MPASARPVLADLDWPAAVAETVEHLRALIRIPTVNPPGGELAAARWLHERLVREGIESRLLEPAPERGIVVARLRGTGGRRPVLLVAHTDVVAVADQPWTTEPFGGELRDGYVYGRGAFDDKGMVAVHLATMLLLKRHVVDAGHALAGDVIFLANADEEAGGELGMGWLLREHPELVGDAGCALNEGGRLRVVDGRLAYAAIQTAEKVQHVVRVTATGSGGHASVPLPDNAITRLARALAAIGAHREPLCLTTTTRRFLAGLAAVWPDADEAAAMRLVGEGSDADAERGGEVLARVPSLDAVLRAGISPTRLQAGTADNVIPPEAAAVLNVRTIPGQRVEEVLDRLRAAVADPAVRIERVDGGEDSPESDADGALFVALRDTLAELAPDVPVVPYLSTGATDSARLRRAGVPCYGLLPFPLPPEDERRMHAADERVAVDAVAFGLRLTMGAVARMLVQGRTADGRSSMVDG